MTATSTHGFRNGGFLFWLFFSYRSIAFSAPFPYIYSSSLFLTIGISLYSSSSAFTPRCGFLPSVIFLSRHHRQFVVDRIGFGWGCRSSVFKEQHGGKWID